MNTVKIYTLIIMLTLGIFPNIFVPFLLYMKKKMAGTEILVNLLFIHINGELKKEF